jgi:alpha-beta hydrolase superfamily lysophospholipase
MSEAKSARITVGEGALTRDVAVLERSGGAPGLFWMGGYRSDMTGSKAVALDEYAAARGLAATRYDYSGHGVSSGRFEDGTISQWLEDSLAVFARTTGPRIVVGSSMGGWLALLLAQALKETGRVAGLVLIAPAVDMTRDLMWEIFDEKIRAEMSRAGAVYLPSDYSDELTPVTLALIEDGRKHLFGDRLIATGCPVHILQGAADREVPWQHAMDLVSHLASDDVVFTLIKDADHRLSRPEDLDRLRAALDGLIAEMNAS